MKKYKTFKEFKNSINESEGAKLFSFQGISKFPEFKDILSWTTLEEERQKKNYIIMRGGPTRYEVKISAKGEIRAGAFHVKYVTLNTKEDLRASVSSLEDYLLGRALSTTINAIETIIKDKKSESIFNYLKKAILSGHSNSRKAIARLIIKADASEGFMPWLNKEPYRIAAYNKFLDVLEPELKERVEKSYAPPQNYAKFEERSKKYPKMTEKEVSYFNQTCGKRGWKWSDADNGIIITRKSGFIQDRLSIYYEIPIKIIRSEGDFNTTGLHSLKNIPRYINSNFMLHGEFNGISDLSKYPLPIEVEGDLDINMYDSEKRRLKFPEEKIKKVNGDLILHYSTGGPLSGLLPEKLGGDLIIDKPKPSLLLDKVSDTVIGGKIILKGWSSEKEVFDYNKYINTDIRGQMNTVIDWNLLKTKNLQASDLPFYEFILEFIDEHLSNLDPEDNMKVIRSDVKVRNAIMDIIVNSKGDGKDLPEYLEKLYSLMNDKEKMGIGLRGDLKNLGL